MAFFRNDKVNLLNLHYAVHALALSGGGTFFIVFLLRQGVSAPLTLAAISLILAGRFVLRPLVLPPARRWGLRPILIAGTLMAALQYPLLAEVHGPGWRLLALCAVSAASDGVYWTVYHAYFAALGDAEHRGHQIGAREAVAAMVGIGAPLIAGVALTRFGARVAFDATAVIIAASALPLLGTPNVKIAAAAPGAMRAARPAILMFAADSWIAAGLNMVWPMALFLSLGESFTNFGGAMALAGLVGAASGLWLGRLIDGGHGRHAVWLAAGSLAAITLLRAVSYGNPALAVIANAAGSFLPALYTPVLMTSVYNQAKVSPCVLRFHIATEAGWDVGAAGACLTAAALLWAGAPMGLAIGSSLLGVTASFVLLRRYYGRADA